MVYSEADRGAPWLELADEAVCIGPAPPPRSYLDADAILQAAEQLDCQAVHPGYGFLAEEARFAARCEQQGLRFIGPPPGALRRSGDKVEARRAMAAAGIAVLPGSEDVVRDADEAVAAAARLGYPVLLKARGGGGGRGMRRCEDAARLRGAFAEASREAAQAFGDGALYLERYLEGARHIEFQIVCDAFGGAIHLGERECTVQRHHQKLLEEAPSPVIDAATRQRVGLQAARALAALGYRTVGTVEFLRDAQGRLYFLEVNARLQVEHPVTEMLTGIDLVELQLRTAALEPLPLAQEEVRLEGHAIECRINAEDPEAGFRPAPGRIERFEAPRSELAAARVRWDGAVRAGMQIPPHYDSLLGKLVVHAPDRRTAIEAMRQALGTLRVEGVKTTATFLRRVLDHAGFAAGDYDLDLVQAFALTRLASP